jgi:hypothetical protein
MIGINVFTNSIKINDVSIGEISRLYSNLFVPAPVTFIIWGVIYLALLGFVIYFLSMFRTIEEEGKVDLYSYVAIGFSFSAIANIGWIFSWHYDLIMLSMICIVILFVCLCLIDLQIKKKNLDIKDILFLRVPFSLYFGWIMVAMVANVVVLMVKFSWDGFGSSDEFWTILIICITAILAIIILISGRDPVYGIVILWGFIGILIKHISSSGFEYLYPDIVIELVICIGIFVILISYYLCTGKSYSKRMQEDSDEDFEDVFDEDFDDSFDEESDFPITDEDREEQESMKSWLKEK